MKLYFEEPTLRIVCFETTDVLTVSPENPDDINPGGDTPVIPNP